MSDSHTIAPVVSWYGARLLHRYFDSEAISVNNLPFVNYAYKIVDPSSTWWKVGCGVVAGVGICLLSQKVFRWMHASTPSMSPHPASPSLLALRRQRAKYDNKPYIFSLDDTDKPSEVSSDHSTQSASARSVQPRTTSGSLPASTPQDKKETYDEPNSTAMERSDVPENAPDACPGVYSEHAGYSETCDGCPNQVLCASGDARNPDPTLSEDLKQLNDIKHKILVLSGKGGVGKSTVASQIAWALQSRGFEVGLLDVDICGPSIPRMTGMVGRDVHLSAEGWSPIYVEDNFAVMSVGFLLPDDDDPVIWRGPKKNALIRQFLTDVTWRELDFLIVDAPPGTSDEHLSIVSFLKETDIDGALVITTPQEVALQDVRKEINFCKKVNLPVIGVIENMSNSVFTPSTGGAKKMAKAMAVPFGGSIPMDAELLRATEEGVYVNAISQTSPGGAEISRILDELLVTLKEPLQVDRES